MKFPFFFFFLFSFFFTYSQETCDCNVNFKYLQNSIEENYIGFQSKTQDSLGIQYNEKIRILTDSATYSSHFYDCYKLLRSYLGWFHDPHLNISLKNNLVNKKIYNSFFSQFDTKKKNVSKETKTELTGLYVSASNGYIINIQKNNKNYIGSIIKGDSTFWFPNQIKYIFHPFEDVRKGKIEYFRKDHILSNKLLTYLYSDSILNIIGLDFFRKISNTYQEATIDFSMFTTATFKSISDSTSYLSLPSFDPEQKNVIDSLLKIHKKEISEKPFLIIDLRNNTGGYSSCFNQLLPLIYTKPFVMPPIQFKASVENINMRLRSYYGNDTTSDIFIKRKKFFYDSVGKYVEINGYEIKIFDSVFANPKKIAFLIDNSVLSAAEHLVFYGSKSDKVVIMGVNTGGVFNNLDVLDTRKLPSSFFQYSCPTARYINIPELSYIGFSPEIPLNQYDYSNWIELARNILEKNGK